MNDVNKEKFYGIPTDFIRKLTDFFHNNWWKSINRYTLEHDVFLKSANLTYLYGSMYSQLDDLPPYSYKKLDIFETNINKNLRCIHQYTNYIAQNELTTWISKYSWKCFFLNSHKHLKQIPVPGQPSVIIANKNMSGDILNSGGNVE